MKWIAKGSCIRGAAHIANNMPCQDAIMLNSGKEYIIACVADGHGSSLSKYSDDGSKIATEVVNNYITAVMSETDDMYEYLRTNKELHIPKKVDAIWKEEILKFHKEKNREECDKQDCYKMYGTTLLTIFVTERFIFAMQIGDGSILYADQQGNTDYLIQIEKLLGTETHSLCLKDSWKYFKSVLIKISEEELKHMDVPKILILSTDGYENSFESESDFLAVGADYLNIIKQNGIDKVDANLENWLKNTSEDGSGDDISVVLIYRK